MMSSKTLSKLWETYTNQRVFDIVAAHLWTQKQASMDGSRCVYRCKNIQGVPLKCAIGALIPDSLYSTDMDVREDNSVTDILDNFQRVAELFKDCDRQLLIDLQAVHDCNATGLELDLVDCEESLKLLAVEYKLKFSGWIKNVI